MNEEKIRIKQYENLKQCVRQNLIKPILGEDYYNMGADVYSCDEIITEDIRQKYESMVRKRNEWRIAAILYMATTLCLIFKIIAINE